MKLVCPFEREEGRKRGRKESWAGKASGCGTALANSCPTQWSNEVQRLTVGSCTRQKLSGPTSPAIYDYWLRDVREEYNLGSKPLLI